MRYKSVLLVSTAGCTPKRQINITVKSGSTSFKSLVARTKRWFKRNPSVGTYRSLLVAKDAKEIFRNLSIYTDIGKANFVALFSEKE
jgi:predicted nucleotidyltransferase